MKGRKKMLKKIRWLWINFWGRRYWIYKDNVETNHLNTHRELRQLFHKYGIEKNEHLNKTGIYEDMFEHIKNMCN